MPNTYTYLFEAYDNGYGGCDRTYFTSDSELTQHLVNLCIKSVNHAAGRIGSNFKDLVEGALLKNIHIEKLNGQHRVDGVFENIQGNY